MEKKIAETIEQPIRETDIFFFQNQLFPDDEEGYYDVDCYNGYAIGYLQERCFEKAGYCPKKIRIEYPTLEEVLKDEELCQEIIDYRCKGMDYTKEDIHYGDIMILLGKIIDGYSDENNV